MNRRNVLIGLGTIVAGGGAALGTGAFSTVEADRTVDLSTTGDGSALLALDDGGSELVTVTDDGDGQLELSSESLNQNALTRADGAIEVTNNGKTTSGSPFETIASTSSISRLARARSSAIRRTWTPTIPFQSIWSSI
ncbi:hypothetical protein D8S78_05470 [Natrialba swarupiae]|nr:hypothetical protein [Natrialba swarupiae]